MQELDELYTGGRKRRVVRRKSSVSKKKSRVVRRKSRVSKKKSRVVRRKSRAGKKKSRVVRRKSRVGKKKSRVVRRKSRVGKKGRGRRMLGGSRMQHLSPAEYTHTPVEASADNVTEGNEDLLNSATQ